MERRNRVGKLNIIEPWEFGTEKAVHVSVVEKFEDQYLFSLAEPLLMKGLRTKYLIGELREEKSPDILSDKVKGTFALNMVFSDEINEKNFRNYLIKDFRGNFLLGEIILE